MKQKDTVVEPMGKTVRVAVGSVTYALKAQEALRRQGIRARVEKTPNPSREEGCGYSLLAEASEPQVLAVLGRERIPVRQMKWAP